MKNRVAWAMAAALGLGVMTAEAADIALSGFGTLGYAKSNQTYNFERFINNQGTLKRDSVAGVQADIKFNEEVSATVQGKVAPSVNNDTGTDVTLNWAFMAWRPTNDWLFRVGKLRSPIYLYSESMDVGVTHDFARLPTEMYSLAPTTDYLGASVAKTWNPSIGELTVDAYTGSANTNWRFYQRDNVNIPGALTVPGANFQPVTLRSSGMVFTLQQDEDRYRASIHKITATLPTNYIPAYETLLPAAALSAGLGLPPGVLGGAAYSVLPQARVGQIGSIVLTLGTELHLPHDFRLIGEYGRRKVSGATTGIDSSSGYFAVLKDVGGWTPYASYAVLKSRSDVLGLFQSINGNTNGVTPLVPLPAVAAAAGGINASQRVIADALSVFDQQTFAIGTSYRISPTQKLKAEWARTHIGVSSNFVDAPAGTTVSNQNIDVLSFSYNVAF